jgi:L-alanine-DL-glutamate epimerase-like enolase superfamily enzyme
MKPDHVKAIEINVAGVTPKTNWIFVELATSSGLHGVEEATLVDREDKVLAATRRPALLDQRRRAQWRAP